MVAFFVPALFLALSIVALQSNAFLASDINLSRFSERQAKEKPFQSTWFRGSSSDAPQETFQVSIEYCTGCRWDLRSFWMAQELLSTFQDDAALTAVTLIPNRTEGGHFVVQCHAGGEESSQPSNVLWNRKDKDGFPEMKELKQLVRDHINPSRFLGHSDSADRQQQDTDKEQQGPTIVSLEDEVEPRLDPKDALPELCNVVAPNVAITYCTGCRWLLRAAYVGQELLRTFDEEINSFTLIPSRPPVKGGAFLVLLDGSIVYDRSQEGRFPDIKELKQLLRDRLNPSKDLGHSDNNKSKLEEMDDEDAEEARRYFGVM